MLRWLANAEMVLANAEMVLANTEMVPKTPSCHYMLLM